MRHEAVARHISAQVGRHHVFRGTGLYKVNATFVDFSSVLLLATGNTSVGKPTTLTILQSNTQITSSLHRFTLTYKCVWCHIIQ